MIFINTYNHTETMKKITMHGVLLTIALFYVSALWVVTAHPTGPSGLRHATLRNLQVVGRVENLRLINAVTDQPILNLTNGMIINVAAQATSNFNIQAVTTDGTVGSVRFRYNAQANYRTEKDQPFAFCGDGQPVGNYYTCSILTTGQHNVTATPFFSAGATGMAGTPFQVSFTIINVASLAPTMAPTQAPTQAPTKAPSQAPTSCTIPQVN
jgi:hypothetical protein